MKLNTNQFIRILTALHEQTVGIEADRAQDEKIRRLLIGIHDNIIAAEPISIMTLDSIRKIIRQKTGIENMPDSTDGWYKTEQVIYFFQHDNIRRVKIGEIADGLIDCALSDDRSITYIGTLTYENQDDLHIFTLEVW